MGMNPVVARKGVFFALQDPEYVRDPYPLYHRLRTEAPLHWDFVLCGWFLTRYADVRAALADPRLTTRNFPWDVGQLPADIQAGLAPLGRVMGHEVLYNDEPEHHRLRLPLNRAFNPAAFERLRPGMEELANQLAANAEQRGAMDVVRDYSEPLGDYMIGELLGLPPVDRSAFVARLDRLRDFVTARRMGPATVARARAAVESLEAVRTYVRPLIEARREHFKDDLIGHSLAVRDGEKPATEEEILANCIFFMHAGIRNMSAAITNAVAALLQHPQSWARLGDDPRALTTAADELLRFDTPIQVAVRGVREQIEIAGQKVGPNQILILLLGAANRDPEHFEKPDSLLLDRRPNRHVAFGVGAHGCVGGWMARFGIAIALSALARRGTRLRLAAGELLWHVAAMRRTVRALPVKVEGAPARLSWPDHTTAALSLETPASVSRLAPHGESDFH